MGNKLLVFGAAAVLALPAGASAQQKAADVRQKAAAAPQAAVLAADTAAEGHTARPAADSAARGGARLSITTDPPEAAVKIDGEGYGLTPVEAAGLDVGSHVVELSKSGYFRRKATIRLDAEGAELHFELSRPAALAVTSEPAGARITIDGQDAGASPALNDKMRPGVHQVAADLDGYKRFEASVELASGGADTLRITLEPDIVVAPPPQEPEREKKAEKTNKPRWRSSTILIAFFVFIAVLIGVEKSSY